MQHNIVASISNFGQTRMYLTLTLLITLSLFLSNYAFAGTNSANVQRSIVAAGYSAQIQRTSHNIAHITAEDMPSAWFGQGYAMAEDRICTVMDQIIKIRGQRSRYFGPGAGNSNIDSDFGYRHLGIIAASEQDWQALPTDIREMLTAHAAGINAFVDKVGAAGLPSLCRNATWIIEVTPIDLFAYSVNFGLLNSSRLLLGFLNNAAPPQFSSATLFQPVAQLSSGEGESLGSNGWGLGGDLTESGNGILLAQPHFPWEGELQSWESHVTVPGKIDIYGVTLPGIPNVLVGFNQSVAWTLTVTPSTHHTLYKLKLTPEDPTKYLYDGEVREMQAAVYTIDVLDSGTGEISQQSRTLWRSHYGPILAAFPFTWTSDSVLTYRDANLENRTYLKQLLDMSHANGIDQFIQAHQSWGSLPFSHTVATSIEGEAWYADSSPVPNVSDETYTAWQQSLLSDFIVSTVWNNAGLIALDGSTSRDEWIEVPGASVPGTIPFPQVPQLQRRDFVFNANDNHWLSNPNSPLEGFDPLYGAERTAQSLRTRMNAVELTEKNVNDKFTLADVQHAALSNRSLTAKLLRTELVQRCTATPVVTVGSESVDLTNTCAILAAWDETFDLDSQGAILFREFLSGFTGAVLTESGALFANPFDANNPVSTPSGLASASAAATDPILTALARAVQRLSNRGIDAILRDFQFTPKNQVRIPIHGGQGPEGILNIASFISPSKTTLLPGIGGNANPSDGYVVNFGTSFLMAVELTAAGPQCQAILTFSQSEDPESTFFADQTELFSNKTWRQCLYSQAAIQADPALQTYRVHALTGDLDSDGNIDRDDIRLLLVARNTPATGNDDKRDLNGDGKITARDARILVTLCTQPRCAVL